MQPRRRTGSYNLTLPALLACAASCSVSVCLFSCSLWVRSAGLPLLIQWVISSRKSGARFPTWAKTLRHRRPVTSTKVEKSEAAEPTPTPSPLVSVTPTPTPTPVMEIRPAAIVPPNQHQPRDLPYGVAVPNQPGIVTSPYAPTQGYVDVRGIPSSTEVLDPFTGKVFLTP